MTPASNLAPSNWRTLQRERQTDLVPGENKVASAKSVGGNNTFQATSADIVSERNDVRPATAAEIGLTHKQIHEAWQIRNVCGFRDVAPRTRDIRARAH